MSYLALYERVVFKGNPELNIPGHDIKYDRLEAWAYVVATAVISALTIWAVYRDYLELK